MPERDHVVDANVETDTLTSVPDGACVRFEQCGNVVPHNGRMCGSCLDEIRRADSNYDFPRH